MNALALLSLGFSGIASIGFDSGVPSSTNTAVGTLTGGHFNTLVVRSQPSEPPALAPAGIKIPIHKDSDFSFVIIVPDDGKDKGGGWQEAKANLLFIKITDIPPALIKWKCPIAIQVPMRTETMGKISPSLAATMSAGITNMVTIGMDFDLPQGIFCDRFVTGVEATFKSTYPRLGARVKKW